MATIEDLIKLNLDVTGTAKVEDLARKMDALRAKIAQLDQAMKSDPLNAATMGASFDRSVAQMARYQSQVDAMHAKATQGGGKGGGKGGGFLGKDGILQAGRVAQDVQYGFGAILNNLVEFAPAAGLAGVAILAIANNAEKVAKGIGSWKDGLDGSQQGLKDNLTILQQFVDGLGMDQGKITTAFADLADDFGFNGVGGFLRGDPAAARMKAEADAGREALGGIRGKDEQGRMKALRETVEQFGGSEAFRGMLTKGLDKPGVDAILGSVGSALKAGDAVGFDAVRRQLSEGGFSDVAFAMEANLPSNKAQADRIKKQQEESAKHNERAKELQAEREEEAAKEAKDKAEEAEKEAARLEKGQDRRIHKQVGGIVKDTPGAEDNMRARYLALRTRGLSEEEAEARLRGEVAEDLMNVDSSIPEDKALKEARGIVGGMEDRLQVDAYKFAQAREKEMYGRLGQAREVFKGTGLADKLMTAGMDIPKESLDVQKAQAAELAEIKGILKNRTFPAVVVR